jgi:hypothetical protein
VYLPNETKEITINNVHLREYFVYVFEYRNNNKLYKIEDLMTDILKENKIHLKIREISYCKTYISPHKNNIK